MKPTIQPAAQRLAELHQLAIEDRTDASMALGRHAELIGELEATLHEHPLRERPWGQMMVCLYRSGRQAEALGAYQRLRRHLGEELGLEPCAELRELEHQMLQQAPELERFAARPAPSEPRPHPPSETSKPPRPTGTVTFLFTDIEGSTRRWEADPVAMRAALAEHDRVLRGAIEGRDGWCFKHTGDGVCAAFNSPRAAIDAAVAAQQELGLPVRMGIATGECESRDGDYFGPALNRAARIMGAGHGGMILLSGSTAALVETGDLISHDLIDLGEHRLRDLSATERLFQLRADGLRSMFPPLRTLNAVPGNLAVQPTSFLGRERELKVVIELVQSHRLVTLTGVGGVGKTRLASHAAAELTPEFPDGVWLVELAPLSEPAAVPDAVAAVLRLSLQAGQPITEQIAAALVGRRLLLVLDNCEHLLDPAAALIETVLAVARTVKVLATSREGLRLPAEQLCPVPPLDTEAGADSTAVELFVERARAVLPDFDLHDRLEKEAVTDICRRLDGIALAIELAAARMVSLSAQNIRDRLGDRFRLLAAPRRGEPRHQTLRNVVQWSFDLLSPDEAAALSRASVFSEGFDLDAATHVCGQPVTAGSYTSTGIDEFSMLDLLESLVHKSLITVERSSSSIRYGMLETIRQFADAQLNAAAEEDIKRRSR